jgi:uncharacterized membrane protein
VAKGWVAALTTWTEAGLIDEETAARIRAFELEHAKSTGLRWPIRLALGFGALMLGAGVLLFVSAHWDTLSPQARFALVICLVAAFHIAGATVAERFPGMGTTLHAVGTVALGAGIFLAGQIFNLDEHWPGGLMLWAFGAAIGWALLGEWPQMALVAILVPAWLSSEWFVAAMTGRVDLGPSEARVAACGIFLLALTYFTAVRAERADHRRLILLWLGGISLLPAALALIAVSGEFGFSHSAPTLLPTGLRALGWTVALGLPLILAVALRRTAAWPNLLAVFWVLALMDLRPIAGEASLYVWWALGATALVAWGVREARRERINMGSAIFAFTVLAFYFSQVMDKLGRSASLVGLGLLFLAGGWALERVRRRLVLQTRGGQA